MALSPLDIFEQQIKQAIAGTTVPSDGPTDRYSSIGSGNFSFEQAFLTQREYEDGSKKSELEGIMELAPLMGGKKFFLGTQQSRNELAERFGAESDAYNLEMLSQAKAGDTFMARLDQANSRLSSIRSGMNTSASKSSSMREYSGIARSNMEATSRYLSELEKFKAPTQEEIGFTFMDPMTGKELGLDSTFDEVYSDRIDPKESAREEVYGTFSRLTDKYRTEFTDGVADKYGNLEDYIVTNVYGGKSDLNEEGMVESMYKARERGDITETTLDFVKQFERAKSALSFADQTAEALAMAEMTGYDGNMQYQAAFNSGNAEGNSGSFDMSQSLLFFNADHNKLLDDMYSNTAERFEIARLGERSDIEQEFNRRRDAAMVQRGLAGDQLRRNQAQEQGIAEEKQRVRQLMEEQRIEYAQTLSSFGSTSKTKGDSISFGDIRPQ